MGDGLSFTRFKLNGRTVGLTSDQRNVGIAMLSTPGCAYGWQREARMLHRELFHRRREIGNHRESVVVAHSLEILD